MEDMSKPSLAAGLSFVVAAAVLIGGGTFAVYAQREEPGYPGEAVENAPLSAATARLQFVTEAEGAAYYAGAVSSQQRALLGFDTPGRIEAVLKDVGDKVKEGEVLARLDARTAEADLAAAKARVAEAQAALTLAEATEMRQTTLVEQEWASPQRLDEVRAQTDSARAALGSAEAAMSAARARLDLSRITAPFSGVIAERLADAGAAAAPGQPVFALSQDGPVEIRVGLPAHVAARLEPGDTLSFIGPDGPFGAAFRASSGEVDPHTQTAAALFDPPEDFALQAGEVVRLRLDRPIELALPAVWVPLSALSEGRRGLWVVYAVVEKGGRAVAEPRMVDVVFAETDRALIQGAVDENDLIIVEGLHRLSPGQAVTPMPFEGEEIASLGLRP